jgi:hypothetical protein
MHRPRDLIKEKEKVKVRFMIGDLNLVAFVYAGGQERVLDILNNDDKFIPIEVHGEMRIVNKLTISWLIPEDQERMEAGESTGMSL